MANEALWMGAKSALQILIMVIEILKVLRNWARRAAAAAHSIPQAADIAPPGAFRKP